MGRPAGDEDLREGLVSAALSLLDASGDPADVTVSRIVERAGCTPPTLYHYWPNRDLLLREAGLRGLEMFQESQRDSVSDLDDPVERIRKRGSAYLTFALSHPMLFRVLFLDAQVSSGEPGVALTALVEDVAEAVESGSLSRHDPFELALALWATVHGVAALWATAPGMPHDLAWRVASIQQEAVITGFQV